MNESIEKSPAIDLHAMLQRAYDHFNDRLFEKSLEPCMITLQREKRIMGHFSPSRWVRADDKSIHEIALNPSYFANLEFIQIFQTLAHEMCHLWRYEESLRINKPIKRQTPYHDKIWANKMDDIGLTPSDTGLPGGRRTGQRMSDYAVKGGLFEEVCAELMIDGFALPWVDALPSPTQSCQMRIPLMTSFTYAEPDFLGGKRNNIPSIDMSYARKMLRMPSALIDVAAREKAAQMTAHKRKTVYQCECLGRKNKFWGAPGLRVICEVCGKPFSMRGG
jgi:predicted SprT family Zn-dependent metalloprotease